MDSLNMNDLHHQPQLQVRPGVRAIYSQHDMLLQMLDFVHIEVRLLGDIVQIPLFCLTIGRMELDEYDVFEIVDRAVDSVQIGWSWSMHCGVFKEEAKDIESSFFYA